MMLMNELITPETFLSIENLEEFIEHVDPESYLARVTLEYLVINSKSDLLEKLIEKLLTSSCEESRDWADVYQIDHLVYKQEMSLIEATQQLTYKKVKSCELATLIKVFQLYNYYDLKNFEMIATLSLLVDAEIRKLGEGFMKNSLLCRQSIVMQAIHLQINDIEKSRECGLKLLDSALTATMQAVSYNLLGNSYILSDKEKALVFFNKSLIISNKLRQKRLINDILMSINFVYCYWGEPEKTSFNDVNSINLNYKHSFAYFLIKSSRYEEALKILDEIEPRLDNDYLKGFDYYYRGLINKDVTCFERSSKYFELAGNYYYRQLPLNEIQMV
jgi:tetratricopeptide (TPR) repeat protein